MNCPKCARERIEARKSGVPMRDATQYSLTCLACGYRWTALRGWRGRPGAVSEWANVVYVPSAFERKQKERQEKIDRVECPECGAALVDGKGEDMGHLVRRRWSCAKECGFYMERVCRKEDV